MMTVIRDTRHPIHKKREEEKGAGVLKVFGILVSTL